ncbi:MAG: PaaI family thioesterase [Pseudomonadota bacterium]
MSAVETKLSRDDLQDLLDGSPFTKFIGARVTEFDREKGAVTLEVVSRPEIRRIEGHDQIHGGIIAALLDTAGDLAVAAKVGAAVPTADMRVDYLRPLAGVSIRAVGTARKVGRTLAVADIELFDADDRLCAIGRATYLSKAG